MNFHEVVDGDKGFTAGIPKRNGKILNVAQTDESAGTPKIDSKSFRKKCEEFLKSRGLPASYDPRAIICNPGFIRARRFRDR